MKETVNVNIGSVAFTLDRDAYDALQSYFDDLRNRLPENDTETMDDIETRMAEILRERVSSPMRVITLDVARGAMAQMGHPSDFGQCRNQTTPDSVSEDTAPRQLVRSRTDRSIAGICGGLGAFFRVDSTLLRLATLLLLLVGGLSIWIYIILWIVVPEEPARKFNLNNKKR